MWMDGQRTKTNPKTSPEQSAIFQLVQEINKTNFYDDWAQNVTSIVHVIQLTGTIFQLNSRIKETNILAKFHENWAKNVTSRVFTCFHYIHIKKNDPPTGGHTDIKTNFELDRDIIGTNLLTKFHEDRTINVAFRVFTNKIMLMDGRRTDVRRTNTVHKSSPEQSGILRRPPGNHVFQRTGTIFKLNSHVTSRVLTCFHYIHIEKNAPPTGGHKSIKPMKTAPPTGDHVFQRTRTTFQLNHHIIKTNILTNFELDRDFIGMKLLTKFHEDRTINVASRVFTNK
ncbi:hypothetical protein DPMN_136548, partial [Dreissena polymorpha]